MCVCVFVWQKERGKKNGNQTREERNNLHHLISMMRDKHGVGKSYILSPHICTNEDEYPFQRERWKEE